MINVQSVRSVFSADSGYPFTVDQKVKKNSLVPLLTFKHVHLAKFHFHHIVFLRNTGLGTDILFIKLELYCTLASKKNQYLTDICLLPKWK